MAAVKPLPIRELTDLVLDWSKILGHPRKSMVGNLLRLNLSARQEAKDVIVGLELRDHSAEAAEIERAIEFIHKEAGAFDRICAVYNKGLKRTDAGRASLRQQAKAFADLLQQVAMRAAG